MSVLETPRIYFRGQIAWDPITTNNYANLYDETGSDTYLPCAADRAAAFRKEAIAKVLCGNWNPHGTHRSTFFDSAVSGADLGAGPVQSDPFIESPAIFMGMLVDLEPYGAFSSQLFFDKMTFGIDGGYRIAARRRTRFTARYINFGRNPQGAIAGVASVVWQTAFAKDDLRIDAFDSPALQALQRAVESDAGVLGLTVQWNAYRTIYYDTPDAYQRPKMAEVSAQLVKKLEGGGFQPNPARSMMVGTIGLWREGEPVHEPCDRTLITGPDDPPRPPTIGSAHARLTADSLTLDLSNSISEDGIDLVKHDFGDLSVVAVDPATNAATTLATFGYAQYDRAAYEKTSGIVVLDVDPSAAAQAASADLQLRNSAGQVLLVESALRTIPLVPNQYLDQGDASTARMQVYDRGVPAGANIPVAIYTMSSDGSGITCRFQLTTAADGTVSFPLSGDYAGIVACVPVAGPNPVPPAQGIDPQVYTYMYVRTLATDDYSQLKPTWANVYANVLVNWHAMAPCMDNWLDLGSEAQVRSFAPLIKKLTDPAAFEHFRYMPVTRDLTPGARKFLYAFLDSPPAVSMLEAQPAAAEAAAEEKPVANIADLSRKMRS